jgi:hypothetical protein
MADVHLESAALTTRQRQGLQPLLDDLRRQQRWHGDCPVALLDRCWLRLEIVAVRHLARRLPPDATADAPELVAYRQLLAGGMAPLDAQERCWQEFGLQACQQALERFWSQQDLGNHGWTFQRYLELLQTYRQRQSRQEHRGLPLLILARADSDEEHELVWLL